jgi:hypothetical protein
MEVGAGALYMLVMPNGSRYWRYNYRFKGKLNARSGHCRLECSKHPVWVRNANRRIR